jgi:hypothetical protein
VPQTQASARILSVHLPADLADEIIARAVVGDRSTSAEMRRGLKFYLGKSEAPAGMPGLRENPAGQGRRDEG